MHGTRLGRCAGALLLVGLAACGTIRTHREFGQPLGSPLMAGPGGVVVRMNKSSDLPNVFGKRDIWGGRVDRGFSELRLVEIDGATLVLDVLDVNRQSSETVMDRYRPFDRPGVIDVDVNQDVNVERGGPVPYRVRFDTTQQREFFLAGIRVTFLEVQPYSVQYRVEDTQPR